MCNCLPRYFPSRKSPQRLRAQIQLAPRYTGVPLSSANPRRRIPVNDETRKSAILIAAAIFAARTLSDWDGKRSPKAIAAVANAIEKAQLLVSTLEATG